MNTTKPIGDLFPPGDPFPAVTLSDSARITTLEARQAELEYRIAQLERELTEKVRWPWIGAPYTEPTPISEPNACRVCGIHFEGIMGYVCPHTACPSRITCSAQTSYDTSTSDCGSVGTTPSP